MKKIVRFYLMFLSVFMLTACHFCESAPIKPQIIGIGNLQYDTTKNEYFIEVNAVRYQATEIYAGKFPFRIGGQIRMYPYRDMEVTCFKSLKSAQAEFMLGTWTEEEIEDVFKENYTFSFGFFLFFIAFIIFICFLVMKEDNKKRKKSRK